MLPTLKQKERLSWQPNLVVMATVRKKYVYRMGSDDCQIRAIELKNNQCFSVLNFLIHIPKETFRSSD